MRHFIDLHVLRSLTVTKDSRDTKGLGMNDFYSRDGDICGTVQTFGQLPPPSVCVAQIMQKSKNKHPFLFYGCLLFSPLMWLTFRLVINERLVIASIIEDSPQHGNRVWSENGVMHLRYRIVPSDFKKVAYMRRMLSSLLRPFSPIRISRVENNDVLSHVCGTCRMGSDPKTSVVDRENRVHGIQNLYVVDSSFFPTSGGMNPALTIAANALRVADILIGRAQKKPASVERITTPSL